MFFRKLPRAVSFCVFNFSNLSYEINCIKEQFFFGFIISNLNTSRIGLIKTLLLLKMESTYGVN